MVKNENKKKFRNGKHFILSPTPWRHFFVWSHVQHIYKRCIIEDSVHSVYLWCSYNGTIELFSIITHSWKWCKKYFRHFHIFSVMPAEILLLRWIWNENTKHIFFGYKHSLFISHILLTSRTYHIYMLLCIPVHICMSNVCITQTHTGGDCCISLPVSGTREWKFDKGCRILLTHCKIRETYCAQTFCKWYLWCVYCLYNITEWLTGVSHAHKLILSHAT